MAEGYAAGSKTLPNILDDIVNGLITAGGGKWKDIIEFDAGATMWTTANKTGDNAKRALRYIVGSDPNPSESIYLSLTITNTSRNIYPNYHAKGIEVVFSQSWDSVNHTYPVSNQKSHVPLIIHYPSAVGTDMATCLVQYYMWVESNGFVILMKPEPTGHSYDQSIMMVIERSDNKEWSDSQSNFYFMGIGNIWNVMWGWDYGAGKQRGIMRPFLYTFPADGQGTTTFNINGYGVNHIPTPNYYAFKSQVGQGKVYYVKPIINNQANALSPIFQAELWFPWSEGVGIIDGDVIAIEGSQTKFLCKALDSPDSTNRLCYAIKYVA
ncbi:MAG: hypothetical protein Q7J35_10760 [Candidatus Methanoperedens sp.]|nr:hypothetical protein [Candidatus Methanoperedens sp.]